jgi:hypothetical protein
MKTFNNTLLKSEDEFSAFYNWSERTAVFFQDKKQKFQINFRESMLDLMCMAAITIALVNCI